MSKYCIRSCGNLRDLGNACSIENAMSRNKNEGDVFMTGSSPMNTTAPPNPTTHPIFAPHHYHSYLYYSILTKMIIANNNVLELLEVHI